MKKTNFLALLLVLAMIAGLFCACGNANSAAENAVSASAEVPAPAATPVDGEPAVSTAESSVMETPAAEDSGDPMAAMAEAYIAYPLEGENNTISMWYYTPPYVQFVDSNAKFNMIPYAEEATGVHLDFVEVGQSSASEQFGMMVAAGDMPDLIPIREYYTGGLSKAYEEDIIIDIGQYIDEYMPNYAAVLKTLDPKTVDDTLTDGLTLAFSRIGDGSFASKGGFVTRGDWMKEQGIAFSGDLITLDEFTELFRALHTAYDTPYTYYLRDGTLGTGAMNAAFDSEIPILVSDNVSRFITSSIFRKGDEVMSGWTTDGYRAYLEWLLQMFDEGVLYQDFLSLDSDQWELNMACGDGRTAIWEAVVDKVDEIIDYTEDPNFEIAVVPQVVADASAPYVWNNEVALVDTNSGFSISSSCNNPELVCQWENYFWTTDGYMMANYGIEGESYDIDGDKVNFTWDRPVTVTGMSAPNAEMSRDLFTMRRFVSFYSADDCLVSTFPDSALEAIDLWTIADSTDDRNYPAAIKDTLTFDENQKIAEYEGDFLTYADETILKFLDGAMELNDTNWNEYVSTCESMGLPEIVAVYQNAYDQYQAGER